MQVQLNNLINNTKISLFINSKDTVIDIKQSIAFSFPPNNKINASNLRLSYLDPKTNHIISMLSPYRTILSYEGITQSKILYVELGGIQLDSVLAIILENILPILTFYYLYKNDFYYTKLFIHKIIFLLTSFYFVCRLMICLKCYNSGNYFLSQLIFNLILYWVFYSIICGKSIFCDDFDNMTIYSYLFVIIFLFSEILCVKLVKEHKDNQIKNFLFNYVKYPYFTMDCFAWISMMFIIYNKRIIFFTIVKIIYNIYLAYGEYIEEQGLVTISSYSDYWNNYNNYNNSYIDINGMNRNNKKVIFPFIL